MERAEIVDTLRKLAMFSEHPHGGEFVAFVATRWWLRLLYGRHGFRSRKNLKRTGWGRNAR